MSLKCNLFVLLKEEGGSDTPSEEGRGSTLEVPRGLDRTSKSLLFLEG